MSLSLSLRYLKVISSQDDLTKYHTLEFTNPQKNSTQRRMTLTSNLSITQLIWHFTKNFIEMKLIYIMWCLCMPIFSHQSLLIFEIWPLSWPDIIRLDILMNEIRMKIVTKKKLWNFKIAFEMRTNKNKHIWRNAKRANRQKWKKCNKKS